MSPPISRTMLLKIFTVGITILAITIDVQTSTDDILTLILGGPEKSFLQEIIDMLTTGPREPVYKLSSIVATCCIWMAPTVLMIEVVAQGVLATLKSGNQKDKRVGADQDMALLRQKIAVLEAKLKKYVVIVSLILGIFKSITQKLISAADRSGKPELVKASFDLNDAYNGAKCVVQAVEADVADQ